jgi:hypothetical protein
MVRGSGSRLAPFELGQIKVHADNGPGPTAIAGLVRKEDGTKVSKETVRQALRRLEEEPGWRGERREGSGRPRVGTDALDHEIRRALVQRRGEAKPRSKIDECFEQIAFYSRFPSQSAWNRRFLMNVSTNSLPRPTDRHFAMGIRCKMLYTHRRDFSGLGTRWDSLETSPAVSKENQYKPSQGLVGLV